MDAIFKHEMQRMYSLFGDKSYPEERLRSIWRACKDLPDDSFRWIVSTFIDTQKYAPLPKDFKELAYREKVRLGIQTKEAETKPFKEANCKECGDSGNLFVVRRENHEPWAKWERGMMRCYCEVGRRRPASQGPIFNDHIARSYEKEGVYKGQDFERSGRGAQELKATLQVMAQAEESPSTKSSDLKPVNFWDFNGPDGAA